MKKDLFELQNLNMGAKEKGPKKGESGDKTCTCEMNPWPSFIKVSVRMT